MREDKSISTQSDICETLYLPKQTVNSALKHLEADGCIDLLSSVDHRSKCVSLTKKGVELTKKAIDPVVMAERTAFLYLSEEELDTFIALFQKYTKALKHKTQNIGEVT